MSVLKWSLEHRTDRKQVEALARQLGFKESEEEDVWVKKVSQGSFWRETKLRMRDHEVIVFIHKAQDAVTETYFEYLVVCGFLAGKLASRMEMLDVIEDLVVEDDNYDMDLDDLDLQGQDED